MGRVLTFADPAVLKMAKNDFVPVAADDWYQRRRDDDEGKFFRAVADQGPRKGQGGSTRQGIYVFTASGRLLAYRNHYDPEVMRSVLQQGLKAFRGLPLDQRAPGAVKIAALAKVDTRYHREPPKGGLIVTVFTRILDRKDGAFRHGTCEFTGGDKAARDHLWLTADECRSLFPASARKGDVQTCPERLVYRIARFHLVDNTRGEPPAWNRDQIRRHDLKASVEEASADGVTLKITGHLLLATAKDSDRAERGFDVHVLGQIHYSAAKQKIDRFDLVALGDHWGQGPFTRNARPGRQPLGVAFELASGNSAADLVPPQGARWLQGYIEAEK